MTYVITMSGARTIREAEDTMQLLRAALTEEDDVALDCGEIEEVDLTFIQLVMAARKSALRQGKDLTLTAKAGGVLLAALDSAGIKPDAAQRFWFEEGASR